MAKPSLAVAALALVSRELAGRTLVPALNQAVKLNSDTPEWPRPPRCNTPTVRS